MLCDTVFLNQHSILDNSQENNIPPERYGLTEGRTYKVNYRVGFLQKINFNRPKTFPQKSIYKNRVFKR